MHVRKTNGSSEPPPTEYNVELKQTCRGDSQIARSERNETKRLAQRVCCRANARLRGLVTRKYNFSTPLRHSQARATSPGGRGFDYTILGRGRRLCQEQDCKQLCKMIVYNFVLVYLYALGSRTERSGGRLPKAPCVSFEARNASIE